MPDQPADNVIAFQSRSKRNLSGNFLSNFAREQDGSRPFFRYAVGSVALVSLTAGSFILGKEMADEPIGVDITAVADELEKSVPGANQLTLEANEWDRSRTSRGSGDPVIRFNDANGSHCIAQIRADIHPMKREVVALDLLTPGVCLTKPR